MNSRRRIPTRIAAAAGKGLQGALALLLAQLSHARADDASPARLPAVLVTAQRPTESELEVPVAVSVLKPRDMDDLAVRNFDGTGLMTPNVNVQRRFGTGSGPLFSMRGLDAGAVSFETDQRIALYLDDVYMGRQGAMSAMALGDLCGMETLRGPQGTLFGRNAEGGVIRLQSCAPAQAAGLRLDLGAGNGAQRLARLALDSGRIGSLSARLVMTKAENRGYVRNDSPGVVTRLSEPIGTLVSADSFGRLDSDMLALSLRYAAPTGLTLGYRYDRSTQRSTQPALQLLALHGDIAPLYDPALGAGGIAPQLTRRDSVPEEFTGTDRLQVQGHAVTASAPLNDTLSLKYILGLRRMSERGGGNDLDGTSFNGNFLTMAGIATPAAYQVCYLCTVGQRRQRQASNELRLRYQQGALDIAGGLFALRETGSSYGPVFIGGRFEPGTLNQTGHLSTFVASDFDTAGDGSIVNKSQAAYAHLKYRATEALDLAVGLRRTRDERSIAGMGPGGVAVSAQTRNAYTDWEASALYRLASGINAYARFGTGHMAGGVQGGEPFLPEAARALEAGLKAELLEQRLRFKLAVFDTHVSQSQILVYSPAVGSHTVNASTARQGGLELETQLRASAALALHATLGYVRATNSLGFAALTPRRSAYLGGEYRIGTAARLRLDASWHDAAAPGSCQIGQSATLQGCTGTGNAALTQAVTLPARTLLSARLGFGPLRLGQAASATVSFWLRNALDSRRLAFARDMGNGTVVGTFEQPRAGGAELNLSF